MNMHKVFFYGTLKKGEPNHFFLEAKTNGYAKFISKGETVRKYPLVIVTKYNIPFLLHKPWRGENVIGEIYEIDDQMLSAVDALEEHPYLYERQIEQVQLISENEGNENTEAESEPESVVDCWIYFLKKFRPSLLAEPHLTEYHSIGNHAGPYVPGQKRPAGYHARDEVLFP